MYNCYIPEPEAYAPVGEVPKGPPRTGGAALEKGLRQVRELLKSLHLDRPDSGDLLLLLIVLLLWKEEKDTDLLLALGGAMLMGNDEETT